MARNRRLRTRHAIHPCCERVETGILPAMNEIQKNRTRALVYWGAALLSLLLGYLDLWRGGETLAPILLVLGYVVLVPLAILKG